MAPAYVEPGFEGDALGIEGRHRHNMENTFGYLHHLEQVVNSHAGDLYGEDFERRVAHRAARDQASEIVAMEDTIGKTDAETKTILEFNDAKLKDVMEVSTKAVWDFLAQSNSGIHQMLSEADASFARLLKNIDDAKAAEAAKLPSVAAVPNGLAFVGPRADIRLMQETMDANFVDVFRQVNEAKA